MRFITYVAIGGVALGVGALLLALAIVRGFSQEIEKKIVGFGAHVQVSNYVEGAPLEDAPSLRRELSQRQNVSHVSAVVERPILLRRSDTAVDGVVLLGMNQVPAYMEDRIVEGAFDLSTEEGAPRPLVVGRELATRLDLQVGQSVTAFALKEETSGHSSLGLRPPRVKQFRVEGIYNTSLKNIDDVYVFSDLATTRWLSSLGPKSVSRFNLTVDNAAQIDSVAAHIESDYGFPIAARTVYEQYSGLFAWVNLQQSIIPLVIGVIVIVAAFNIIGTLLMLILEKTGEIGVLQSLGASGSTLKRLFLTLGLLIGGVGTAIGSSGALGLALIQQRYEVIPLPAEAYYMTTAPIALNPLDFVIVSILTVALCAAAAYVPARVASRIEPVRAIRFQ